MNLDIKKNGNEVFLDEFEKNYTYKQLYEHVCATYNTISDISINGIVALYIKNRFEFSVMVLTLAKCNCSILLLNPELSKYEIMEILRNVDVCMLITDNHDFSGLSQIVVRYTEELLNNSFKYSNYDNMNFSGEILMCTSGTSGKNKVVARTWNAIFSEIISISERLKFYKRDVIFSLVPWSHSLGFMIHFIMGLFSGCKLIVANSINTPTNIIKMIHNHQVTILIGVPSFYYSLLQSPECNAAKIRLALCAGAALSQEIYEQFYNKYGIHIRCYYGCTENGVVTMPLLQKVNFPNLGKPLKNVCLKILDEQGNEMPIGNIGEICISGDSLTHKIYENGETIYIDGEYKTGDMGFINSNYELTITDRISNRIKVNGYSINIVEIEDVLKMHPLINDALVIAKYDEKRNSLLVAYLVTENDFSDCLGVRFFCEKYLSSYKIPREIFFVKKLPTNEKGLVKRTFLKDLDTN